MKITDIDKELVALYMNAEKYGGHDDWTKDDFEIGHFMMVNGTLVPTVRSNKFEKACFPWPITKEKYEKIQNDFRRVV